jgi:RNA-directed DNA polymerase
MSLIRELVERFGLSARDVIRLIESAPARYKVYDIPKRRGGRRTIAQPSKELKLIQRFIVDQKLKAFPVHGSAMGYVEKRNIFANAAAHRENGAILKLDFAEFFPSIRVADWEHFARKHSVECIPRTEIGIYSKILFWGLYKGAIVPVCLSIGAPSSPALSNILLFDLDTVLEARAAQLDVVYTRYADDITASADTIEQLERFEGATRRAIGAMRHPKLTLNEDKRGLYLRGQRRMVTGLIVTPTQEISIGRERKRLISAMLHRASLAVLGRAEMGRLKGLLGFCLATEPAFIGRMRSKYGDDVIERVLRFRVAKRTDLKDENED